MYLRDKLGSFEVIVDKERRVVHEKLSGLFTYDDSSRLNKVYKANVLPYLGAGRWAKLCDMTEYVLNTSVKLGDINSNFKSIVPYGFEVCAVVVNSEAIKNYLSLASCDIDAMEISFFPCEQDAEEFLINKGFK